MVKIATWAKRSQHSINLLIKRIVSYHLCSSHREDQSQCLSMIRQRSKRSNCKRQFIIPKILMWSLWIIIRLGQQKKGKGSIIESCFIIIICQLLRSNMVILFVNLVVLIPLIGKICQRCKCQGSISKKLSRQFKRKIVRVKILHNKIY